LRSENALNGIIGAERIGCTSGALFTIVSVAAPRWLLAIFQVGVMKAEALPYTKGPEAVAAMSRIKRLMDPKV